MSYSAEISRSNPTCFLFLIDQSWSMADPFGGSGGMLKKDQVADVVNRLLDSLGQRCVKGESTYHYFDVGVIGYSSQAEPAWTGNLAGQVIHSISTIYENPAELEKRNKKELDGAGGLTETSITFPIWFKPVATGGTSMCAAFKEAHTALKNWVSQHPNSYPPTVINITDGESTDGDPTSDAERLKQLQTNDGAVLLYNIHLSSKQAESVSFLSSDVGLADPYAKQLFNMSSILPTLVQSAAKSEGFAVNPNSRAFIFNADPVKLIQFLDIGTRGDNMR